MTLILAGHIDKHQLFFAADSTISDGKRPLIGGFRKVYEVPVIVFEPHFVGKHFHGYPHSQQQSKCVVAFAGNTLTAQHALNSIEFFLGTLEIGQDKLGKYAILRKGEYNKLTYQERVQLWAEDMFTPKDTAKLLTGKIIAKAVAHAIQTALSSARKYSLDELSFRKLENEYAIGTYSPADKDVGLYVARVQRSTGPDGQLHPIVKMTKLNVSELAVLGMRDEFESTANQAFQDASATGLPVADAMFNFLQVAIDKAQSEGSHLIDRPAYFYEFSAAGLITKDASGAGLGAA